MTNPWIKRMLFALFVAWQISLCHASSAAYFRQEADSDNGKAESGRRPTKSRVALAPFEIRDERISDSQVQGALDAVAMENQYIRLLPTMAKLKSVSDVEDIADLKWDDQRPDYVIINTSLYRQGDLLVMQGTVASTEAESIGFVRAFGVNVDDVVEQFWLQIDRPVADIGVPDLLGTWVDQQSQRQILVAQNGSIVFGRIVSSPQRLLKEDDWCFFTGKFSRGNSRWTLDLTFTHRGVDYKSWSHFTKQIEMRRRTNELEFENTTWRRLSETPKIKPSEISQLNQYASGLKTAIKQISADTKPEERHLLAHNLAMFEIQMANNLSANPELLNEYQRSKLNDTLWQLETVAREKSLPGAGLIAGIPIIGRWNVENGKLGRNSVFGMTAYLVPNERGMESDFVLYKHWTRESAERPGTDHEITGYAKSSLNLWVGSIQFALPADGGRANEFRVGLLIQPVSPAADGEPRISIIKSWVDENDVGRTSVPNVLRRQPW